MKMKNCTLESSKSEKRSDVTVDSNLTFGNHITNPYRKVSQKIHAYYLG